ncbi:hypothetical protein [Burkholderia ubonensis]|uniref:hypothetical protein n=1 Tax=Burkholderia ubonensis TaxID=101571 RepID=UPI000A68436A|nr:hypothetical protein [Burkholderia ubonensis]
MEKAGMITGWIVLAAGAALAISSHNEKPTSAAVAPQVTHVAPSSSLASSEAQVTSRAKSTPTVENARRFIAEIDAALKSSSSALARGDLKSLHDHSVKMNRLKDEGEQFGNSVFDKPFGYCFAAGIDAQSWWMARVYAARNGSEATPNEIDSAMNRYREDRAACLAATGSERGEQTEYIASTSDTPPRPGCLKVFGPQRNDEMGVVAYTCPKN